MTLRPVNDPDSTGRPSRKRGRGLSLVRDASRARDLPLVAGTPLVQGAPRADGALASEPAELPLREPVLPLPASGGTVGVARRSDLAAFLRNRRERVQPEQVGLMPGQRRRALGLRREEVAMLAGVGVTWYTWLEQGRPINVSASVLESVSRALHLDRTESRHLFQLAGLGDTAIGEEIAEAPPDLLQPVLDGLVPLPGFVRNSLYDILAWNAPFAALFPGLVALPPKERNTLRAALRMGVQQCGCCAVFVNREAAVQRMVASFRADYARHLRDSAWVEMVATLRQESDEFARLWDSQDVAAPVDYVKVFRHREVGDVSFNTISFAPRTHPGTFMVVYLPADEISKERAQRLLALPDREGLCR
ncbi:MAG TPA: helix-turn-helix transcriptional regulator [Acidimicrobiales bacterium]|nr:helix-turn-helix transcriptional regulator [Acidimicrobiales bacterium]